MGYIGTKRSVNSQFAIEDYEVPLTHFNKDLIQAFINENEEYESLRTATVKLWKYVAERIGSTSWHHTGSYYNETNHYSLSTVAEELLENKAEWEEKYKVYLESEKESRTTENIFLSVIKVQIWGGTKKHPKMVGYEQVMGVIKGDWLHAVSQAEQSKYKLSANKVEAQTNFLLEGYNELVKKYPSFKAKKRAINKKVKELFK
ncbi:hypothetical protein [Listeria immobilis]|uniref:hypothetical protein n=1 Tax=Listeria immobilis TaxID=2713502 RepID=UPI00164DC0D4|nr:hypothetical protein [Listeria immobilis]MBC6304260.1 hypothetical protein [Listeria immobilis]MBC6313932.1 hypothetical protein [Listeria immobilis]